MKKWLSIICFFTALFPAICLAVPVAGKPKAASIIAVSGEYKTAISSSAEQFGLPALHHVTSHPVSQHTNSFHESTGSILACRTQHWLNVFCRQVEMFGNNQLSFNYPSHNFW